MPEATHGAVAEDDDSDPASRMLVQYAGENT